MKKKVLPRRLREMLNECHKTSFAYGTCLYSENRHVAAGWCRLTQDVLYEYLLENLKPEVLEEKSDNGG